MSTCHKSKVMSENVKQYLISCPPLVSKYVSLNILSEKTPTVKPGFHLDFLCLSLPFLVFPALSDVRFCFFLFFVAFCCFWLLAVALSGFVLLLMSTTFQRSRVEANE